MNKLFLNHLADILDGLPPYQLSLEANQYDAQHQDANTDTGIDAEPVLHRLDRFFMTGDIRNNDFEPSWIDWNGTVCGNLEAWAALTAAREQDIPLPLTQEAVAQIAAEALCLPDPPTGTVLLTSLSPLLNPACLLGRFDAITPQHAAVVLRACANGENPAETWNRISLAIRNQRLLELADIIEKLPSASGYALPSADTVWTPEELQERLSTLVFHSTPNMPVVMKDGSWGANLALWTLSRFGNYVPEHLGNITPKLARHTAGMVLGLTYLEATALFYGALIPDMDRPTTHETYQTIATQDAPSTSRSLRLLAAGAVPPIEWDDVEEFLAMT